MCSRLSRLRHLLWILAVAWAVPASGAGPLSGPLPDEVGAPERGRFEGDWRGGPVVRLQPLPDAEVLIPNFRAVFHADGSVTVQGGGTARAGAPTTGFAYTVDPIQGTYTTHRLGADELEAIEPLQSFSGVNRTPADEGATPFAKVSPGTWLGRVRVQAKDPPQIVLTETKAELKWTVAANGNVSWNSYSDGCWAANPSALGTHWSVTACANAGAWSPSATRVCNDHSGSYENFDFLDPAQVTTVSQSAWLCGRNDAIFDYNWSHTDGGEAAFLLGGSVVIN